MDGVLHLQCLFKPFRQEDYNNVFQCFATAAVQFRFCCNNNSNDNNITFLAAVCTLTHIGKQYLFRTQTCN